MCLGAVHELCGQAREEEGVACGLSTQGEVAQPRKRPHTNSL